MGWLIKVNLFRVFFLYPLVAKHILKSYKLEKIKIELKESTL